MDEIADLLIEGDIENAIDLSKEKFPFEVKEYVKRSISKKSMLKIFFRDGFIDRYSKERLYHPGFLRLIHEILPEEFPFHKNGKRGKCHDVFWDKMPSVDHIIPIYRGGSNDDENLVTTSMKRNLAKNNSKLDEIGWELFPGGNLQLWSGCTRRFLKLCNKYPSGLRYVNDWRRITVEVIDELELKI